MPGPKGFESITYGSLEERVRGFCAVLRELGLKRGDKLCLQSENCYQWSLLDWGCQCLGIILVPIYPSLPDDQTQHIVKDCEASLVVSSSAEQSGKVAELGVAQQILSEMETRSKEISISVQEWEAEISVAQNSDLATVIYTSGTTGHPKGVMLPQSAPLSVCYHASHDFPLNHNDTFLTFLPMSHVFERVVGQWLPVYMGATIVFSKSLATLANDMLEMKPTVLLAVPRFLEATMDKIIGNAKKQPALRAKLFQMALSQGVARVEGKFAPLAGILDKIVGEKVRARLGGRMRFMVSGGAALPHHVSKFYLAFNLPVMQGYGLTETASGCNINRPDNNKYWTVGPQLGSECKIAPDGEILIRGKCNFTGYYNLPEETAAAIDSEGWFYTGDIGEFEGEHLKITDRKKDILVLANGKNIAPQPIENRLKEDPHILEVVLFGDGNEFVYGLVVPNLETIKATLGLGDESDEEIVKRDDVKALVKRGIDSVNKGLADFERVKRHTLLSKAFTIESGELTPSLKVKRKVVREKYSDLLNQLAG